MKSKLILLLACLVMVSIDVPAQSFGNKLKNKVLDKMNKKGDEKIDQTIDSAVDKPVDKTEEKVKQSVTDSNKESKGSSGNDQQNAGQPSEAETQKWMEMMGGGAVTIEDYPDLDEIKPSPWLGSFDMVMKTVDKNGKPVKNSDGEVSWFIDKYDVAMIPEVTVNGEQQDTRIIVKRKQGIMLILTTDKGKKTGMVVKMQTISVDLSETELADDMEDVQVEVYRNDKQTVNNQPCYKVKAWNDEFESISWVSERIGINFKDLMGFMSIKSKGKSPYEDKFSHIKGVPVRTVSTDKKTGEVSTMDLLNVTQGTPNSKNFNSDGHELIALPDGLGGFGGQ